MSLETMELEQDIHQLVLAMDGVAGVFAADPVWMTAVKQLGALLATGADAAAMRFVVSSEEDGTGAPVLTVRVRIGTDGSIAAPRLARSVAAGIRAFVAVRRPGVEVKAVVEIAAIGA